VKPGAPQFFVVLQGWSQAEALTTLLAYINTNNFFFCFNRLRRVQQVNQAEKIPVF